MPIIEKSPEQQEFERERELEDQAHWDRVEELRKEHELKLQEGRHKRDVDIARLKHAVAPRQVAVMRVILAIVKMPALVILAIAVPFLVWRGRGVPSELYEFLNL